MTFETTSAHGEGRDAASLRGLAGGGVFLPGDEGYDRARTTWALGVDLRPAAVAFPRTAAEVSAVVRAAAVAGLRVAPLGTGHNAHPLDDLGSTVLLRMNELTGLEVDADRRRIRAGAGEVWLPVVEAAGAHGLAAMHGSSPDTGVVGYTLNGGLSWYARSLGLAVNSVTAVEIVTGSGELTRVDADHEPDLFWALRGGNAANFGVVTALEFTAYPIETAYAGMLVFDVTHAHRVLERWVDWSSTAPDAVTTAYRHLSFPPIPEVPELFRGRSLAVVDGAVVADDAEAERIIAPLRELGPEVDTFARVPAATLPRLHMDPEQPTPGGGRSVSLGALPAAAVDRFVEVAGPDCGLAVVELRQLGGALARRPEGAGAVGALEGSFGLLAAGLTLPETAEATIASAERVVDAMAPWAHGLEYLNYHEVRIDPARAYDAATLTKLRQIHKDVDPTGQFVANHPLG
ncbi:FAD-binding oxidoreductase [Asanoa siamensis]|uniref:FAD-linked oxidase n=1 Tax=Asanoa siamensis TaxID=926357 RepID=A0ABQ4CWE6_9ACTN|nr:FAD-binding protein [Asanoa siamensis]GIF75588.1 FAD-linked oxidase [Asanoa siamensis]